MKILGVSLGHDSNFSFVDSGKIVGVLECERFYRTKHYKLHAITLQPGKRPSGFQYTDIEDLRRMLTIIQATWGSDFDLVVVQNQGRIKEHKNFLILCKELGFHYKADHNINHHLCHAASSYFTSPFSDALILSYDGSGNDGCTVLLQGKNSTLRYLAKSPVRFGQSYNNLGYILNITPDVAGSSSGKTMGLTAYGAVREEWITPVRQYIHRYRKISSQSTTLCDYGRCHVINAIGLSSIPELKKFIQNRDPVYSTLLSKFLSWRPVPTMMLPDPSDPLAQDLAATVQYVWTDEVMSYLQRFFRTSENLCVTGGCALNGITNYRLHESSFFQNYHFIPNPSDCGLSLGAALFGYYSMGGHQFSGSEEPLSPYLGFSAFDQDSFSFSSTEYPQRVFPDAAIPALVADLLSAGYLVGVIRGRCEIGPRALGNRSILANPLLPDMKQILNDRIKHREWFRPFAPVCTAEDSTKYFTASYEIPYMSLICYIKEQYRSLFPSVTHVDGSVRLQTVRSDQNQFLYRTLREFEKKTKHPVLLNTSFNPGGEPILNYYSVGLEMLRTTDLDFVLIENRLCTKQENAPILKSIL